MHRILYRLIAAPTRLAVRSGRSKDLELIVLRHQLGVVGHQTNRPNLTDDDRTLLGAIAAALPHSRRPGWLVTPDTLLRWHRQRIARHWAQPQRPPGRPPTSVGLRQLIVQMSKQNPTWGYRRIHGELTGLGHKLSASTIWQILKTAGIDPAPGRSSVTWSESLRSQAAVACDLATIDTALLWRYYLLFFNDIPTRQVYFGGVTEHPTGSWTVQAARNLFLRHGNHLTGTARTPRPNPHLEQAPTRTTRHRLHRPLQLSPTHRSLNQRPPLASEVPPRVDQRRLQVVKSTRCDDSSTNTKTQPDQARRNNRPSQASHTPTAVD